MELSRGVASHFPGGGKFWAGARSAPRFFFYPPLRCILPPPEGGVKCIQGGVKNLLLRGLKRTINTLKRKTAT